MSSSISVLNLSDPTKDELRAPVEEKITFVSGNHLSWTSRKVSASGLTAQIFLQPLDDDARPKGPSVKLTDCETYTPDCRVHSSTTGFGLLKYDRAIPATLWLETFAIDGTEPVNMNEIPVFRI